MSYVDWLARSWRSQIECTNGIAHGSGYTRKEALQNARRLITPEMGEVTGTFVSKPIGEEAALEHVRLLIDIGSGAYRKRMEKEKEEEGR